MTRLSRAFLLTLVLGAGCTGGSSPEQVLTGRVTTSGALAVRAVSGTTVVTATQVRSDGSFTLTLPADGVRYRLEVLTTSGVRHVFTRANGQLADLSFRVCQPVDPYDMGGIGGTTDPGMGGGGAPGCDPMTDENCVPPWPGCSDPMDPNCEPPPPWPCMDPADPNCGGTMCGPNDPDCPTEPPPWPGCDDPMDPNCPWPMPCSANDPACTEPCADPTDPNCGTCNNPMDPTCGMPPTPGCSDPNDPYCFCDAMGNCPDPWCDWGGGMEPNTPGGTTDPNTGTMCPPPPPEPCLDPMDPTTCTNPCENNPGGCACPMEDANCWPMPTPPDCDAMGTMCEPGGPGGMTPENPPGDFGCDDNNPPSMDDPVTPPDDQPPTPEPGEPMGL